MLEVDSQPLGVPRLIGADVSPSGVHLMLGADVPLSGSLMVTQDGGACNERVVKATGWAGVMDSRLLTRRIHYHEVMRTKDLRTKSDCFNPKRACTLDL